MIDQSPSFGKKKPQLTARQTHHLCVRPASSKQLGDQVRILGHVLESLWHVFDAVKVTPDPDVLAAGQATNVFGVIRHQGNVCPRAAAIGPFADECRGKVEHDEDVAGRDRLVDFARVGPPALTFLAVFRQVEGTLATRVN